MLSQFVAVLRTKLKGLSRHFLEYLKAADGLLVRASGSLPGGVCEMRKKGHVAFTCLVHWTGPVRLLMLTPLLVLFLNWLQLWCA